MKIKKLVSLLLVILLFSTMSPAFATEEETGEIAPVAEANIEIAALTLEEVEVQVNVPTEGTLYINPLRFPVEIGDRTDNSQIITAPAYIENLGETPVDVSVSVSAKINEGSTMLLTSSSTATTTSKKAFIYFELQVVSDPDHVTWDDEYDSAKHIPVRTSKKTKKNLAELDAADGSKPYGAFRLTGDCVARPRVPWTAADGIQAVIAFTFQPVITIN